MCDAVNHDHSFVSNGLEAVVLLEHGEHATNYIIFFCLFANEMDKLE